MAVPKKKKSKALSKQTKTLFLRRKIKKNKKQFTSLLKAFFSDTKRLL